MNRKLGRADQIFAPVSFLLTPRFFLYSVGRPNVLGTGPNGFSQIFVFIVCPGCGMKSASDLLYYLTHKGCKEEQKMWFCWKVKPTHPIKILFCCCSVDINQKKRLPKIFELVCKNGFRSRPILRTFRKGAGWNENYLGHIYERCIPPLNSLHLLTKLSPYLAHTLTNLPTYQPTNQPTTPCTTIGTAQRCIGGKGCSLVENRERAETELGSAQSVALHCIALHCIALHCMGVQRSGC